MTLDSTPVGRRVFLALGAASVLGACATPAKTGQASSSQAAASPSTSPEPSLDSSFTIPTPAKPTPGVCPTAPGVIQKPGGPQHYLPCNGTDIALTIDDGPDPAYTPQILALLAKHKIVATFCMVGQHAQANPDLVKRVVDGGHHIANHTFSHPIPLTKLPLSGIHAEINQTSDLITSLSGGHRPTLFRAPGGEWSHAIISECTAAGMRPLDWSVDPRDWSLPGVQHIVEVILTKTHPGSIILDHDGNGDRQQTVDALTIALPRLIDAGYTFTQP